MKFMLNAIKKELAYGYRWLFIVLAVILASASVATSGFVRAPAPSEYNVVKALVLSTDDSALTPDPYITGMYIGMQPVTLRIISGEFEGVTIELRNAMSRAFNIHCEKGMTILCNVRGEDGILTGADVFGYSRDRMVYLLVAVFALLIIVIGRSKGIYSIISLFFTLIIVLCFLIPRVMAGADPVSIAIVTAVISTVITVFIVSGVNIKSLAAVAGVSAGIAASAVTASVAGAFGNLSGIHMPEAQEMISLTRDIPLNVPKLLYAGIIIASLGAIMDVGMSVSSAVFEVYEANKTLSTRALLRSGMNVGRDIMGTMSNTLILAFAGSSISVLMILVMYNLPYLRLINLDILCVEILTGFAGSIGLILTIPLTALCASVMSVKIGSQA
ncbi:MAG: YibE/F family protein [Clostridiales bacterium]|jgi:uncharacterized membrane protein|nr:YibE/F family protein [Clostridiales bacterium]